MRTATNDRSCIILTRDEYESNIQESYERGYQQAIRDEIAKRAARRKNKGSYVVEGENAEYRSGITEDKEEQAE